MRRAIGLAVLLAVPTAVWAREPETFPPNGGIVPFLGFDDTSAPTQIADGRASDIRNVKLDISRSAQQRFGVSVIGDTCDIPDEAFVAITGIYYTRFSSGTERIIRTCGSRFEFLSGGTDWQQVEGAQITAGQDNQFVFTTAIDQIIGTNDVDPPLQYDGTTLQAVDFTGLTNPITAAKTVIFFKNFLIFGNTVENSVERATRFRWSNVGTIDTWSDEDFVDINALGGQEIIAFAELYDNLYVFLTDSIFKISFVGGADVFQVAKITDDIGSIAKNSVQSVTLTNAQNGLIFLDKDKKIYFFNGVLAQDISQTIQTTMRALGGGRLQYAVSADNTTEYLLCVTNSTGPTNDVCLVFQYEIGEWTKYHNITANAMAHVLDNNAQDQVYWGSYFSLVYQLEDRDLRDDVGSATGTVDVVDRYTTSTASSLQVLYDASANFATGTLVGAPLELIGGTGSGQTNTIADNTVTGLVVVSDFSTTPSSDTTFEVGAIDSFYITKFYDFGSPARLKHFGEVYFWADADVSSTHSLSYATDFNADVSTLSLALSASTTDSIWGSAIWGVSLWGSVDTVFRQGKLEAQGRFVRFRWAEDDPGEAFRIYGFVPVFWSGDIN